MENQTPEVSNSTQAVPVADTPQPPIVNNSPVVNNEPQPTKGNGFMVGLLSVFLFLSVAIAGFFAYQTQNLSKELMLLKSIPTPTYEAVVEPTQMPVATSDPTASWKTYTNTTYGFSFKFPETLENKGTVAGSYTGTNIALLSFSDPKTIREGTDAPFDGYSLYYVTDIKASNFEAFIQNELNSMNNSEYASMAGARRINIQNGGVALVTDTRGYYYIPTTDPKKVVLFAYIQANQSFKPVFDQILSTFKFTN